MSQWIIDIMNQWGYLSIFLLIAVENIFPPIPSELILAFGGFLTASTGMHPVLVIAAATAGSLFGAFILYEIGAFLTPQRLKRLLRSKPCALAGFKERDVDMAGRYFEKYGVHMVLLGRCIPIIRSLISIPAGTVRMSFPLFFFLTALGSAAWNTLLVLLGRMAGEHWTSILQYFSIYTVISVAVLAIVCLPLAVKFIKRRFY